MRAGGFNHKRKKTYADAKTVKKGWVFLILIPVILGMMYLVASYLENSQEPAIPEAEAYVEPARTIEIGGEAYEFDHKVRTYVFLGSDDNGNPDGIGEDYVGPMTDFVMVVVVDDDKKTVDFIQPSRDTIMDVHLIDYWGNDTGETYREQLCTASYYGGNIRDGFSNVVTSVQELLGGTDIDGYYAIPIASIPEWNHLVGGVEVTVEDDFSEVDDTIVQGTTMVLSDEQAETFCRARFFIGDGENTGRMRRQRAYIEGFIKKLKLKSLHDDEFVSEMLSTMQSYTTSNVGLDEAVNVFRRVAKYDLHKVHVPKGKIQYAQTFISDGDKAEHAEFILDEKSMDKILMEVYPVGDGDRTDESGED